MASNAETLIVSALQVLETKMREIRADAEKEWFEEKHQLQAYISQLEQRITEYEQWGQKLQTHLAQEYSKIMERDKQLASLKRELDKKEKELTRREQQLGDKLAKTKHASDHHRCIESLGSDESIKQEHTEHDDSLNATHPDLLNSTNSLVDSISSSRRELHSSRRERSSSLSRSSRPRSRAKVYGVIRPGSVTHENVQRRFSEYFVKYRRQYGSLLMEYNSRLKAIPCHVLQVAFDMCRDKVVRLVQRTLSDRGTCDDVRQANNLLVKCCVSTSSMKPESRDLQYLFDLPIATRKIEATPDGWEERKYAFSLLLNSSAIEGGEIIQQIKEEILEKKIKKVKNPEITNMLDTAVRLAWDMVTLVPPAIVCQPEEYREEWQEKRFTYWNEDPSYTRRPLQYYRPVLFFSTLGHVGCKGEVGNTSKGATVTPDQQGFYTPMSSPSKIKKEPPMHIVPQTKSAYFSPRVVRLSKKSHK